MNNVLFTTEVIKQEHQGTKRLIKGDNWRNNPALDGCKHAVIAPVWGRFMLKVIKSIWFLFAFLFGPHSYLQPDFFALSGDISKAFRRIFTAKVV